jgi:hypothetical protein
MRPILLLAAALSLVLAPFTAQAGRLDLAVMQFSDARDAAAMDQAVKEVDLMKVTDSDRTETIVPAIRGGWVLFTQSIGVGSGAFANSTRLGNQRADVSGTLNGSNLSVRISILEGVKVGLRKHRENVYEANGSVAGGVPQIVGIRQSTGKTQTAIKGRATITSYNYTTIIVARYQP